MCPYTLEWMSVLMKTMYDIQRSKKFGLPEHFIVTKDNIVFLRIIGEQPYEIWTATADEDGGDIRAYTNRMHIVEVALKTTSRLAKEENCKMPEITPKWKDRKDKSRREYFIICECDYLSDAY